MSVLTSPRGKEEVVHCRRTESQDIFCIKSLIRKFTQKLFGRLNIIYLLEKANLAVTLCNDKEEIMAHAIFLDYPNWNVANQDDWVSVFQELDSEIPCTPLNTLFMHFFVAVDEYSTGCLKEIIRTVFKAVPELHFIFLIVPTYVSLGSTLVTVFGQVGNIPCLTYDEDFAVYICHRHDHYPQLHIRKARVEDHDDLMPIFLHYDNTLREIYGEYFLAELIEAQDEENHSVVCEVEGKAVGFMSVCSSVNLNLLHECFDLGPFHGFCVPHPDDLLEPSKESSIQESQDTEIKSDSQGSEKVVEEPGGTASSEATETQETVSEESSSVSGTLSDEAKDMEQKFSVISIVGDEDLSLNSENSLPSFLFPEESSHFRPIYLGESAAFCIQLFCIDEKYEARSLDFMSFVFSLFPDKKFCLISVPHLTPEFVLIQNFVKVVPFNNCTLEHDLYVFHRAGLLRSIKIRLANFLDTAGVENLVSTLILSRKILDDLAQYNEACRDPDGTALQVFVAEVANQIVGIAVIRKEMSSYALYHTNRKLTLEPKVTVNARIVVIGASSVGISFLETLVFCSHLKFNNLTLISTHGLPGKKLLGSEQRKFLASDHCFNDKDYALMSLCSWVNVVVGRMTGIDRAAKHVVVSQNETVFYDHLILCTGQQYQVPCPTGADMNQHLTNREVLEKSKKRYTGKVPYNLFILNDEEDCVEALIWMRNNSILTEGKVIVYGNTLDAYTTVETLLHIGMKGDCIYFVHPPADSNISCINNYVIESAVEDAIRAAKVAVYRESLLAQWNDGQDPDPIHSACFTTPTKPFRLECSAFFSFYKKNVDYETFKAFNDACLVYDGRLVIDTTFHTNDIAIRAAGSLTKFSNRYYSDEWTHSNFSSKEIGFQLAAAMLTLFDPTLEPVTEPPADLDRLIPMYKGAKIQGGILPGSYYYLHIAKPAIPSPLDVQRSQPDFGSEIITGNAKDGTYFRLYINKYKLVEAITCFSKEPFPVSNYIRLIGQHEQILNNLFIRFYGKMIPDLYSYFMEPWCMALFHDRFIDLRKELRQILNSKQEEDMPSMEQLAYKIEDEEINLNEKPQKYLQRVFEESIYKDLLEKSILDYLHYSQYHLPMYAWPGII
ncbi:cilia- and flagella-associated protein 61 isoform X3 [Mesocricetus auratus]|uniref:Cilia- and flagella-associated protein 61 isoform X3 n=1 Tax=Mesocricetus auratus TaxID=10036 RepID=A0ABM2XMZ2_MESAU|nr:cilia- and flagella-associated protein 61 isoform X3 [Mesocricetus auratus]